MDKEKFVQRVNVMLYETCGCNNDESVEVLEECLKRVKANKGLKKYDERVKPMKRQAIQVSIKELEDIIKCFKKERFELKKETGIVYSNDKKFQVNIINKEPKCSDTWEFELSS